MTPLLQLTCVFLCFLHAESSDESRVVASLYDTVILRCSFPFIKKSEGIIVVWVKEDQDGNNLIAHKFMNNRDHLEDQDIQYTGRTELSKEFSQGRVDLTLRGVTFNDEGTYYCRVVSGNAQGDKKVELTINELKAQDAQVTITHMDGKKRLKCIEIGVFRNPWVRWHDEQGRDLSEYGTRKITNIDGSKKMVESVLDMEVETNKHYFCQVKEGRLKRIARAVLSDGKPVTVPDVNIPD